MTDNLRHQNRWGGEDSAARTFVETSGSISTMLEQVVEASLSGVCIVDRQGRIVYANQALLTTWGYTWREIAKKPVDHLWLPRKGEQDCMGCVLSTGQWSGVIVARRKDLSLFDAQISISTIRDPEIVDLWFILSCLDVTLKRATGDDASHRYRDLERAIAAMPERFMDQTQVDAAIDDSLEDLGRACGACRVYLSFFSDPRTMFGTTHEWYTSGKVPYRGKFQKFLTSDLPWWVVQILANKAVLMDGRAENKRMSGREHEFLDRRSITATLMIPLRLEAKVVGFVGYEMDAGDRFAEEDIAFLDAAVHIIASALERKQSEYIFRESENLYQVVLDAITDTVIVVDTRLTILLVNDAFISLCENLGLKTDVTGENIFSVLPFLSTTIKQQYNQVIRTGRSLTSEYSFQAEEQTITIRGRLFPIFERGEVTRVVTIARDITAHKEAEDLKTKAYSQIERNMEQFALLADHIRNPLQTILGYAELMDDTVAGGKIQQQVRRIDTIISQLDERWVESRKLSLFWRRYS